MSVYDLYLAKASEFFGIGKLREIYETAIEAQPPEDLPDADVRAMGLAYAQLERKLGEVRGIEGSGWRVQGARAVGGTEERERDRDMRLAYTQLEGKLGEVRGDGWVGES